MRQRPRNLYKKIAPLRGANPIRYLGTYQDSYSISLFLEQWLLVNSCRFVACLSFIEFSQWSGFYSGSRAPPRYPFFRENRVVLPVKCIYWFKYKFGIIHTKIVPLRRASIIVSIFAAKRRFLPSIWTWSQTLSDYHRLEIWFRLRSEQTLSTNQPTGSALVAMGSSILDFCRYCFAFAKFQSKSLNPRSFSGGTGEKLLLTNGTAGYDLVCTYSASSGRGGAPDDKYSMSFSYSMSCR